MCVDVHSLPCPGSKLGLESGTDDREHFLFVYKAFLGAWTTESLWTPEDAVFSPQRPIL